MAEAAEGKKPAVSPVLVIVLVAALGGAAYFQFFSKPAPPPQPQTTTPGVTTPGVTTPPGTAVNPTELAKTKAAPETTTGEMTPKTNQVVVSDRDPFRPSVDLTKKSSTTTSKKVYGFSTKPAWNGTITTDDGQVAIVNYRGMAYLLRIGDWLPGSNYRLSEINQDSILLYSPTKSLRLRKTEGAK